MAKKNAKAKKQKELRELIIDRKKWGRGDTGGELLNYDGLMCCLGFEARALGCTKKAIQDTAMPADIVNADPKLAKKFSWLVNADEIKTNLYGDSKDALTLAKLNDDRTTSDKFKEREIKKIFKRNGIKVTFIN
jgi:hypothetical protein